MKARTFWYLLIYLGMFVAAAFLALQSGEPGVTVNSSYHPEAALRYYNSAGYAITPHTVLRCYRDHKGEDQSEIFFDFYVSKGVSAETPFLEEIALRERRPVIYIAHKSVDHPEGLSGEMIYAGIKTDLTEDQLRFWLDKFPEIERVASVYGKFFHWQHYPEIGTAHFLSRPENATFTLHEANKIWSAIDGVTYEHSLR